MRTYRQRKQRGFTLTEALVAFLVVTGGLLAVASFQAGLFGNSAYNKARTEALSIAQQKIEEFKHYTLASEDNYIDANGDGVMDAVGSYTDGIITGQNAVFQRTWDVSSGNDGSRVEVTVSWVDSSSDNHEIVLAASLPWIPPRAGGDNILQYAKAKIGSPSGKARYGEGNLADYPAADIVTVESRGLDGLGTYRHGEDLFLVDLNNNILLTLEEACSSSTGVCAGFAKISGKIFLDAANSNRNLSNIFVIASDTGHCERWVDSGTLDNPPTTATGDYEYYNYTCYLGGGWHGNIGFLTDSGIALTDKVCQGDPTSLVAYEQPVIALRRAYRGMLYTGNGANKEYISHGIKDAAQFDGHDFVFTKLASSKTEGANCKGLNGPMTRYDSGSGTLFEEVPVDFVCLNTDLDADSLPDFLDQYDTSKYSADLFCPYDPTDPPVRSHIISGTIDVLSATDSLDVSGFNIVTSDGPGNCSYTSPFAATGSGYQANYSCRVHNWGSGWTGSLQLLPNSNFIFCPSEIEEFANVSADQTHNFSCTGSKTASIEGQISLGGRSDSISSIVIADALTAVYGSCYFDESTYRCVIPYVGTNVDVTLAVTVSSDYVCGAVGGVFDLPGLTVDSSPYTQNIEIKESSSTCSQ